MWATQLIAAKRRQSVSGRLWASPQFHMRAPRAQVCSRVTCVHACVHVRSSWYGFAGAAGEGSGGRAVEGEADKEKKLRSDAFGDRVCSSALVKYAYECVHNKPNLKLKGNEGRVPLGG